MCGIAGGVWYREQLAIDRKTIRRMTDSLQHRGPNDEGFYWRGLGSVEASKPHSQFGTLASPLGSKENNTSAALYSKPPGVALGFRRLSIIDLAGGHQPLGNEDGSIQIVFNGEIYNYRELRRRLEGSGHRFSTESDTETIVHLYEEMGTDCFSKLNGMFSIVIWDSNRQQLVLARDRMGKKPLYYSVENGRLAFASELKALCEIPNLSRTVDPGALDLYFTYQYIPHPWSIYQSIKKMPPGHVGVYRGEDLETRSYWSIDWNFEQAKTKAQAVEEVRSLVTDAVSLRLRSDVPLGAFLSGGIDSSLIVAIAQKQLKTPIRTFAIGFSDADFDETSYAQSVASYVGSEHRRFEVTPDALTILEKLAYHYDEPFSDSSAVPTWYLCEQTRTQVTVALSGDGGDELFAGYERYKALHMSEHVRRFLPLHQILQSSIVQRWKESSNRRSFVRRVKRFGEALGEPPARRYMRWLQIFNEATRSDMYQESFVEQLPNRDPFTFLESAWNTTPQRDLISRASIADMQTYLPCDLMTKVDIASMGNSLEARQPFLDYRLIEFAASLPSHLKYRWQRGKRLLRDAFYDLIPPEIWDRPKMGFGIPIDSWFRGPLREKANTMLLSTDSRCHQYVRPEAIKRLFDSHQAETTNEGYRLWNLLMLELWLRRWT